MKTSLIKIGKNRGALALDTETLIGTRCLIQGKSGSGKSHLVRVIVEQTIEGGLQTILFDPSGEFKTLREKCDILIAGNQKEGADVPLELRSAKQLLRRVAETGISCVLDLSDLSKKDRREFVRIALETLHGLPRKHWGPRIIVVDECQEYAPESGKGKSTALESVIETANQGRKRGHCLIAVTLRLSALSKDVTAELQNKFIGSTDHIDLKRAQDALGCTAEQREKLRKLRPGTYFATGPALSDPDLVLFEGRASKTTHPKPGTQQRLKTPPPSRSVRSRILKEFEALPPSKEEEEAQNLTQAQAEIRRLSKALQKAEKALAQAEAGEGRRWQNASQVGKLQKALEALQGRYEADVQKAALEERGRLEKALGKLPAALKALPEKPVARIPQIAWELSQTVDEALGAPIQTPSVKVPSVETPKTGRTQTKRPNKGRTPRLKKTYKESAGDTFTPHYVPELPFSWSSAPGKLFTVLIQYYPEAIERRRMAALAGVNYKSSTFRNALTKLRSVPDLVGEEGKTMWVTEKSWHTYEDEVETLPSGGHLLEGWRQKLGGIPLAIFDALIENGGVADRDVVCLAANTDPSLSTARNAFTKLRHLGLLEEGRGDPLRLTPHVIEAIG